MSYQVLARKWRPQTFADVVGQEHVLTALANGLSLGRIHHAYLFSGTRGVGKTSIARLLAKGLNCETGITATPCGVCDNCREIEQGRFVDLIEIDAASRTKVEDTRDLLDNVQYAPARGRFKVYLIDEVHMLSRHSFNALLKTLEEPPAHVKFLLATTDPQKLPVTILSRCLQFHLKVLDVEQILYDITPANHDLHATNLKTTKFNIKPGAVAIVAEDSKVARSMLEKGLQAMEIPAQLHITGKDAWEKIGVLAAQAQAEGVPITDKIALVLTDLEMPEMDGFTLTRKIKTDPVLKDIPVVIHSSLSGNANEDHIRKVKADGYVAKFELNELSSVIEEVLDRSMKKIDGPLISRKQLA